MSALNITAARSDPLAPSRFTIIMQANSFAYFVLSGVATGISSRARRRESAAYSNGISLVLLITDITAIRIIAVAPGTAACRAFITNIMSRGAPELAPLGGERWDHLKPWKKSRLDRYHFFRTSRVTYDRYAQTRIFHFEMNLWTGSLVWWIRPKDRANEKIMMIIMMIDQKSPRWFSRTLYNNFL